MSADDLFGELPNRAKPPADAAPLGAPRLREPQRDQIALRAMDIESLIGEDHPARLIWCYVGELDLSVRQALLGRGAQPFYGLRPVPFDGMAVIVHAVVIEDAEIALGAGVAPFGVLEQPFLHHVTARPRFQNR